MPRRKDTSTSSRRIGANGPKRIKSKDEKMEKRIGSARHSAKCPSCGIKLISPKWSESTGTDDIVNCGVVRFADVTLQRPSCKRHATLNSSKIGGKSAPKRTKNDPRRRGRRRGHSECANANITIKSLSSLSFLQFPVWA